MTDTNEARIENTTLCNYNCRICPHGTYQFTRRKETMSNERFQFIINKLKKEAPQIEVITISGMGEPAVDFHLEDKVEYAKKQGYIVNTLSNAALLTEERIERLFHSLDSIRFSIHSLDSNEYTYITNCRPNDLDTVIHNINYAISLKNKYEVNVIITADIVDNKDDMWPLIDAYSEKADLLEIWKPHNWVDNFYFRKSQKPEKKLTCGRPFNGPLQIQVDGTINMCCFDFNGELLLGDYIHQSLDEIFTSDMYHTIIIAHSDARIMNESNLICTNCDQRLYTTGTILYNSKFSEKERVNRLSTTYRKIGK